MLISCPNCSATFAVPAKAIGETGKKVKCSKCGHMWHQEPIRQEKTTLDTLLQTNEKQDKNLPVKTQKNFNYGSLAAGILLLIFIGILQFMAFPKTNEMISSSLGLADYSAIKLVNFSSESQINDNKLDIKISGIITNTSGKITKAPALDVKIMSKGGRVIAKNKIQLEKPSLEPYEIYKFDTEITKITGNADNITITFGNWLENMFF
ncbi:MAG: zinc-ribbon domain-containing protein [Rickettsiales bacterium]|nr:zinc-ribbon domain-containing protein [Rickettsiales bacterium]